MTTASRIIGVTRTVEDVLGWPESDLLGHRMEEVLPFVGKEQGKEVVFSLGRGKPRRFRAEVRPLKDSRGRHIGFVLFLSEP